MSDRGTTGRPARLRRTGIRSGKALLAMLSVVVLSVTGYGWQFLDSLDSGVATTDVFDDSDPEAEPLEDSVDILLAGLDSRTDAHGDPLPDDVLEKLHIGDDDDERQTDTMILVHIPKDGREAVAISLPRDSWVEIAGGYGSQKLNSAFAFGYNNEYGSLHQQGETDEEEVEEEAKAAGRKNLIDTVEDLLGKPGMIDHYAEVNLASFYEITQAIGGVEVCLNEPVQEYHSGIDLPAGRQEIEGAQALAFVRQRYGLPRFDLDRIDRQKAFLSGLAHKILSKDILVNPPKLQELVGAVQKSVVLSEGWDLLKFAEQMRNLSGGDIEFHTIPVEGDLEIQGESALEVDTANVRDFVDGLIDDDHSEGETGPDSGSPEFDAEVYAAPSAPELGEQARELLQTQGFGGDEYAVSEMANTTTVQYAPGDEAAVDLVQETLGTDVVGEPDDTLSSGTVSVLVGPEAELSSPVGSNDHQGFLGTEGNAAPVPVQAQQYNDDDSDSPITADGVPCVN